MYSLPYFKEQNPQVVMDFIRQHPFAFVVGCDADSRPVATQLPLLLEQQPDGLRFRGHLMRNTDHHKAFERNPEVLCVFSGSHTYVSATWYANPSQASTWNYRSVHVRGKLRFLGDADLIAILQETSLHFENGNPASPTVFDNLSEAYTAPLLKALAGFEIEVTSIDHVFKLSQNRSEADRQTIIQQLQQQGGEAADVAAAMKRQTAPPSTNPSA